MKSKSYCSQVRCTLTVLVLLCAHALAETKHPEPFNYLGRVDSIIEQAVTDGNIPGAVLLVGHDGAVVYRKAYGNRALEPKREVMTPDTVFDLASLT
jgi:CubicO group peptidase (beta-lactamase class C family)